MTIIIMHSNISPFLWLLLSVSVQSSLLKVNFYREFSDYEVKIKAGTPSSYYFTSIDITRNFTWVSPFIYSYPSSQTADIVAHDCLVDQELNISGMEVRDVFQIDNSIEVTLFNFTFFLLKDKWDAFRGIGGIGLASSFSQQRYSVIHHLKQQGLISSLAFSFVHSPSNQGYLYFGGIPSNITEGKHRSECRVKKDLSGKWSCALNRINIKGESYVNTDEAYFDSASKFIFAPNDFFLRINNTYFSEAIDKGQCSVLVGVEYNNMIMCDSKEIKDLNDITFVIDYYQYTLTPQQLFNCNFGSCYFSILPNPSTKLWQGWVLGLQFFDQFDMLFEYERGAIVFYSGKEIPKEKYASNSTRWVITVIGLCFVVLVMGLFFEISLLVFRKKLFI